MTGTLETNRTPIIQVRDLTVTLTHIGQKNVVENVSFRYRPRRNTLRCRRIRFGKVGHRILHHGPFAGKCVAPDRWGDPAEGGKPAASKAGANAPASLNANVNGLPRTDDRAEPCREVSASR